MTTIWKSWPAVRLIAYVLGVNSGLSCSQGAEVSKVSAAETAVPPDPEAPVSQTARASQAPVGGPPDAGVPVGEPNVNGTWAMIDFEDPVVVTLVQDGQALTGHGCCAAGSTGFCCGDIVGGTVIDGLVRFEFPVQGSDEYTAEVNVSAAGDRMTGAFFPLVGSVLSAWIRLPEGGVWLSNDDTELREAVEQRAGTFVVSLTEGDADDFTFDTELELQLRVNGVPLLRGALGAFWGGEMVWREDDATLVVGTVPATQTDLPIALELHFDDTWLESIDVWMPSGNHYSFAPATFGTPL